MLFDRLIICSCVPHNHPICIYFQTKPTNYTMANKLWVLHSKTTTKLNSPSTMFPIQICFILHMISSSHMYSFMLVYIEGKKSSTFSHFLLCGKKSQKKHKINVHFFHILKVLLLLLAAAAVITILNFFLYFL